MENTAEVILPELPEGYTWISRKTARDIYRNNLIEATAYSGITNGAAFTAIWMGPASGFQLQNVTCTSLQHAINAIAAMANLGILETSDT